MALLDAAVKAVAGAQTEIVIFLVAIFVHAVLFGNYKIRPGPVKSKKANYGQDTLPDKREKKMATSASSESVATVTRVIKPMLHQRAERRELARELDSQLQMSTDGAAEILVGLLENCGKVANAELLAAVRTVVLKRCLQPNARLSELLLRGYLGMQLHQEFTEVFSQVEEQGLITPSIALLALRAALNSCELATAMGQLRRLAVPLRAIVGDTPSAAPKAIMQQLIGLAAQKSALRTLLLELRDCHLCTAWTMEAVFTECAKRGEWGALQEAKEFAKDHAIELTGMAYTALIQGSTTAQDALQHFTAAVHRGFVGKELLLAAADFAITHADADLAHAALQQLPTSPAPEVAASMIRLSIEGPLGGQNSDADVLDLYMKHLVGVNILTDVVTGQYVVDAAFRHHRSDVVAQIMQASEGLQQHALLKNLGSQKRLGHALDIFRACPEKTASLLNALLDVCIVCKDMEAAERVMEDASSMGMADVVTYNTIIKAYLQNGDTRRLRAAIETMRSAGGALAPNCVTFNELIDATIRTNSEGVWALIEEMKSCGLQPNHVTCSILLKSIQRTSRAKDVERTLSVVDAMDDAMDEILLSSVCEACIRVRRPDLLAHQLMRQRTVKRVHVKGAHTFGSIIRAYGVLNDLKGVWDTWREMRMRHIVPTSITIGCMVEALASNGDTESAYELIHEMLGDSETSALVNAVIYCSVLKGFSHQRQFDRVWMVYQEMLTEGLPVSLAAFNALIDACARSCDMARVPQLLEDMAKQSLEPNIVTYSTILKGYCQENRLDKAFELLQEMKQSSQFRPDEITYNTLIDGCARYGLFDRGLLLLEEMQEAGVRPSNFTLSVLVKLATRSRRSEKAFEICKDVSQKYNLRLNVQVYNNLLHACTSCQDMPRAFEVVEEMLREKVRPDVRTYTLLVRGSIAGGDVQEAAGLLRAAFGLRGAHPRITGFNSIVPTSCGKMPADFVSEVVEGIVQKRGMDVAVKLVRDLRLVPGLKIDPKLQLRLTSTAVHSPHST